LVLRLPKVQTLSDSQPQNAEDQARTEGRDDLAGSAQPLPKDEEMTTELLEAPQITTRPVAAGADLPEQLEKDLVQVFKLLADETRLKILMFLMREGELHVSALCERLGQSQPAVSHHLALLRVAKMIEPRRDGKHNFYSIQKDHFHQIMGELFSNMINDGKSVGFGDFLVTQQK
jgi:ArsR family transcriptional regulator